MFWPVALALVGEAVVLVVAGFAWGYRRGQKDLRIAQARPARRLATR